MFDQKGLLVMTLCNEFGKAIIPLELVADKYLNMKHKTAMEKFNNGELQQQGLNCFRCIESRKAPVLVLVHDLAEFILKNRQLKISQLAF